MLKYGAWTSLQSPVHGKFPAWLAVPTGGTQLSPPTEANMETYADARYREVRADRVNGPELERRTRHTNPKFISIHATGCRLTVPLRVLCASSCCQVKPYLHGEMCSRGAKVIAWDGTFAEAKRVNDDANVLIILLNEHSHVLGYASATSEKWAHVLPLFMG